MFDTPPNFHDGYLTGIQLLDREVRLSLTRYNDERWLVTLAGVEALHIDDFREGNIVSSLDVIQNERPETELLERLFLSPHLEAPQSYKDDHMAAIEARVARVLAAEAAVVSISPVYGADLVAFVTGVRAVRLDP